MEVLSAIKKRRSIRNYNDKEVNKEKIEDILNCARLAPSAKNRQPWHFIVVNKDIKNKIAKLLEGYTRQISPNTINNTAKAIRSSSVLILVYRENKESTDDYSLVGDLLSIGASIQNMCLMATNLNLGTLWIREITKVSQEISSLIEHQNQELICALAIGYPNENPNPRPRKDLNEIVEYK